MSIVTSINGRILNCAPDVGRTSRDPNHRHRRFRRHCRRRSYVDRLPEPRNAGRPQQDVDVGSQEPCQHARHQRHDRHAQERARRRHHVGPGLAGPNHGGAELPRPTRPSQRSSAGSPTRRAGRQRRPPPGRSRMPRPDSRRTESSHRGRAARARGSQAPDKNKPFAGGQTSRPGAARTGQAATAAPASRTTAPRTAATRRSTPASSTPRRRSRVSPVEPAASPTRAEARARTQPEPSRPEPAARPQTAKPVPEQP